MSQKIDGTSQAAQAQALRTLVPANKASVGNDAPTTPVAGPDRLTLTAEATNLQALEPGPGIDNDRVQAVKASLQNGTYRINPEAIASRMLELDQQLLG